ncbi:hypothetical protein VitviT2T_018331 [Vitis vinifera]|uniref:Uncharacterized protein n=1 Tax=Vitis vinifera TaxID=29760 RepID=A0ABY9CZI3_VITVI|nr:hypothetical protein VitviT2T_018331 [Vitis vinifera]
MGSCSFHPGRNYTWLPPLHPGRNYIRLPPLHPGGNYIWMSPLHPAARHYTQLFTSEWERRAFQLPRSHISGSAYSAYPESFPAILHSAAVFS